MRVNVVSETLFFPKGHGVHTAFINTVEMLQSRDISVSINSFKTNDITHTHTLGPLGLLFLFIKHPHVVSAHIIPISFKGSFVGYTIWIGIAKRYLRFYYNRSDLVLAVSPFVKDELQKLGVKKRIEVLPNPVNLKKFKQDKFLREAGRKMLKLQASDKVVIGLGQISQRKGIDDFIKTAEMLPNYQFIWIGGIPFKKLTAQSDKSLDKLSSTPNITITGVMDYKYMPQLINAGDILLFPSYQENASMAIIEAAACGLPLVLRDLPEYKALYGDGYLTGNNAQDFVTEIKKLTEKTSYYTTWSNNSIDLANKFSFSKLAIKLENYYKSVL